MALEIAKTKNGLIRGALQEGANAGITVFKKVPYAKPPIGALRFKPAEPVADWEGVYDGTSYAPAEFQTLCEGAPYLTDFYFNDWPALSEDCLYLSVTTGAESAEEKRPVYVWFHGGGLSTGFYYEIAFDGNALAKKGIIVVSVAQRLNVFGYLALPQLRDENGKNGNYGFTDQLMAMRWIRENIAAFGGDPDNITIGGQSGGSQKVCMLAGSPAGKGLFKRVIAHSGLKWMQHFKTQEEAEAEGKAYLAACGIDPDISAEALRALPPTIFNLKANAKIPGEMICDGDLVPYPFMKDCLEAYAGGTEFICGTCLGEADVFADMGISEKEGKQDFTAERFYAHFRTLLGPLYDDEKFRALVPVTDETAYRRARELATAGLARKGRVNFSRNLMLARLFGAHMQKIDPAFRNYVFLFSHFLPLRPEDKGGPNDPEIIMAYHSSDLFYAFGSLGEGVPPTRPWQPYDFELADKVTSLFADFMSGKAPWKDSADGSYIEFGDAVTCHEGISGELEDLIRRYVEEEYSV